MGLHLVDIEDFQSIARAEVPIGGFTVIVGPSNSGKSAFLRAIKTAAYNAVSPSFVRQGKKVSRIRLVFDTQAVGLERGKSVSTYDAATLAGEGGEPQIEIYAKSGTSVPKEVQAILRFVETEGDPLNFAFQFDRPYLVSEPGAKVAKVLGDLTNIVLVYDAVREVNRKRLEASAKRKVRVGDEEGLVRRLEDYRGLQTRKEALEALRTRYEAVEAAQEALGKVRELVEVARLAERVMQRSIPAPVDVGPLDATVAEYEALDRVAAQIRRWGIEGKRLDVGVGEAGLVVEVAQGEYDDYLAEVGVCPVCGREM